MSRLCGGQAQDFFSLSVLNRRTAKNGVGDMFRRDILGLPSYRMGGTGYTCVESSNRCLGLNMLITGLSLFYPLEKPPSPSNLDGTICSFP